MADSSRVGSRYRRFSRLALSSRDHSPLAHHIGTVTIRAMSMLAVLVKVVAISGA